MGVNCPKCGAEVDGGKRFCTLCGSAVARDEAPPEAGRSADEAGDVGTSVGDGAAAGGYADEADEDGAVASVEASGSRSGAALPRYWEADRDSSGFQPPRGASEPPEFKVWTLGYDDPEGVEGSEDGGDEGHSNSVFYRKPWLVNAICFGFLGLIGLVIIVNAIRNKTASHKAFSEKRVVITQPNPIEAATLDCRIRMVKSVGSVRVQPRKGTNYFGVKAGQCVPPGATVFTDKGGRALFDSLAEKTRIHVNSKTEVQIGRDDGSKDSGLGLTLRRGEIFVVSDLAGVTGLNFPFWKARGTGPGKFHVMLSGAAGYYTCVEGILSVTVKRASRALAPGMQMAVRENSDDVLTRNVPLDEFMLWVGEWKDDFTPPKKRVAVAKAQAVEKTDERKSILEATGRGFEGKIPEYAKMEIVSFTSDWAAVVIKDTRPDAAELPDFFAPHLNLLKKIDGHWTWIEGVADSDYSEEVFTQWQGKWGFDKKAEAALKLSY